jgi:3-oxoacyl-[acyl-carrier-protein] synthase-3
MVPKLVYNTLVKNELELDEIDYFVFHQANKYILEHLRKTLGIRNDRFLIDMEEFGNTVSSTIPIVLANKLNGSTDFFKGSNVMLLGFGVGYSWGGTVLKF